MSQIEYNIFYDHQIILRYNDGRIYVRRNLSPKNYNLIKKEAYCDSIVYLKDKFKL